MSLSLHEEKSNFFSLDGFSSSAIIFEKYANTSSPRKFLLDVRLEMLQVGRTSQRVWNPVGPISFNEISSSLRFLLPTNA